MIRLTVAVALIGLVSDQSQAFGKRGRRDCNGGCSGYNGSSYSGCCGSGHYGGSGCSGSHYGSGYGCSSGYGHGGCYRSGQYGYGSSGGQMYYSQPASVGQVPGGTATVQPEGTTVQGYPVQQLQPQYRDQRQGYPVQQGVIVQPGFQQRVYTNGQFQPNVNVQGGTTVQPGVNVQGGVNLQPQGNQIQGGAYVQPPGTTIQGRNFIQPPPAQSPTPRTPPQAPAPGTGSGR